MDNLKVIIKTVWYIFIYGIDGACKKADEEYAKIKSEFIRKVTGEQK